MVIMKKLTPFAVLVLAGMLIIPSVASAAWWNPWSWGKKHDVTPKTTVIETKTDTPPVIQPVAQKPVQPKKAITTTVATKQKTPVTNQKTIVPEPAKNTQNLEAPSDTTNPTRQLVVSHIAPITDATLKFGTPTLRPVIEGDVAVGSWMIKDTGISSYIAFDNLSDQNAYVTQLKFSIAASGSARPVHSIWAMVGGIPANPDFILVNEGLEKDGIVDIPLKIPVEAHGSLNNIGIDVNFNPINTETNPEGTTALITLVYVKYQSATTGRISTACASGCTATLPVISAPIRTLYSSLPQ